MPVQCKMYDCWLVLMFHLPSVPPDSMLDQPGTLPLLFTEIKQRVRLNGSECPHFCASVTSVTDHMPMLLQGRLDGIFTSHLGHLEHLN